MISRDPPSVSVNVLIEATYLPWAEQAGWVFTETEYFARRTGDVTSAHIVICRHWAESRLAATRRGDRSTWRSLPFMSVAAKTDTATGPLGGSQICGGAAGPVQHNSIADTQEQPVRFSVRILMRASATIESTADRAFLDSQFAFRPDYSRRNQFGYFGHNLGHRFLGGAEPRSRSQQEADLFKLFVRLSHEPLERAVRARAARIAPCRRCLQRGGAATWRGLPERVRRASSPTPCRSPASD